MLEVPLKIHTQTGRWQSIGAIHHLNSFEIEQLMSCRAVEISEAWQLDILTAKLDDAMSSGDYDSIGNLISLAIRSTIKTNIINVRLGQIVLALGLRDDTLVGFDEATCVRLARVLAVKLDKLLGVLKP